MTDRTQSYTTPPTSPRGAFIIPKSPNSPRSFHTFPLVPPAPVGTHPRHPVRHVTATQFPLPPATLDLGYSQGKGTTKKVLLELADGSSFTGFSFGAVKSVSGELVFQTGNNPFPDFKLYPKYH
jgi:carbamoyl-phosphate synthase / aspartate carbamoyltransferase